MFSSSTRITRDPVVAPKDLKKTASRSKLGGEDGKRRAIALAITEGNEARQLGKYDLAVKAYERAVELDAKDPRGHYGLGNIYADLTCHDSAVAEYGEALKLKNDFRDALIARGYALVNKERYDEADLQFQQLLKVKKDDVAGRMGLAFVLWKRKKYDDAIAGFKQLITSPGIKKEDQALAYLTLGDIHREQNRWDDAREAYKTALNLNPAEAATSNFVSVQSHIGLGLTDLLPAMERFGSFTLDERQTEDRQQMISVARTANEHFRRAIYDFKYNHPNGYLFLAIALEYQLQFQDAEEKFRSYLKAVEALEKDLPTLAQTKACDYGFAAMKANYYSFQAMSYSQERFLTNDYKKIADLDAKTIKCLEQLIELRAHDATAYANLAGTYILQGKYEAAIEQYENALSRETNEIKKARLYSGRGNCYEALGRLKDARDDFNRAKKLQPESSINYWNLSSVYEREGKWEDAVAAAEQAMSLTKPPTAHAYLFYAKLLFRKGRVNSSEADYEKAIQEINQALALNAEYPSAYLLLATLYRTYKNGAKIDESLANYKLAAQYDPNNPIVQLGLGDLYLNNQKNENAAIQHLTKAVTLKPDFAQAYYSLGRAYANKGDYAEGIKQYQNAIKHDPKYQSAYLDIADVYDRQKNYEDAIKWMLKATEEFPTDFMPYKEAARMYSRYQKNEEAIQYYEKSIALVKGDVAWFGEVMKCRIVRLRAQYDEAIACFQTVKVPSSEDPGQIPYDVGLTHVASGNKQAARLQYEELKRLKSDLAENLLREIEGMK